MQQQVVALVGELAEAFAADGAAVWPLAGVHEGVAAQVTRRGEGAGTHATLVRLVLQREVEDEGQTEEEEVDENENEEDEKQEEE